MPRKWKAFVPRPLAYFPANPNELSKHKTIASVFIDQHYANLLLTERWTWERYTRLCQFLKYTPYELASLVMLPHNRVASYERTNRLHGHYGMTVAMLLTLLEAHVCGSMTKDVIANPFPKIP